MPLIDAEDLLPDILSGRYATIDRNLTLRLTKQELTKGRNRKEIIKAVRSKLHQIGGAYQPTPPDYDRARIELAALPTDRSTPALHEFCRHWLGQHASTRERLPLLPEFYARTLAPIGPLHSILDLACGLNPLCLPWLPLAPNATYTACDIYRDLTDFLQDFFNHVQQPGQAFLCDLTETIPDTAAHLTLLLKTLPCLEQVDKKIAPRLLNGLHSEYLLVSFPSRSLSGRGRGMVENYAAHFEQLLAQSPWQLLERHLFANEQTFLLRHT
jgi:16S rRNA (guanine(1405)-N(7))-methyltransferase